MEWRNWADYEGRTRTTQHHLPQIHEQQQTNDPRIHDDETHLDLELQDHNTGKNTRGERVRQGEPTSAAGERREKGGEIKNPTVE